MKRFTVIAALAVMFTLLRSVMFGQSLQERLEKFGSDYGTGYTQPFGNAFGAALNSGWYRNADISEMVSVDIELRVMAMPIGDADKKFTAPISSVEVPTIFGENVKVAVPGGNGNTYPPGFNLSMAPMIAPQLTIGAFMNTRAIVRFIPTTKLGDYGEASFFGIGIQHGLNQYLPMVPVDLSAMVAYSSLKLGDLVSANSFNLGAQVSKSFAMFTAYGGLAYETSSMDFAYTLKDAYQGIPAGSHVGFNLKGNNTVRGTVGASLSLAILHISADYSLAAQPVASVGLSLGFGL